MFRIFAEDAFFAGNFPHEPLCFVSPLASGDGAFACHASFNLEPVATVPLLGKRRRRWLRVKQVV